MPRSETIIVEVVPRTVPERARRDGAAPHVLGFGEQAVLAAHFGAVAAIDRGCLGRPAGCARIADGVAGVCRPEVPELRDPALPRPIGCVMVSVR